LLSNNNIIIFLCSTLAFLLLNTSVTKGQSATFNKYFPFQQSSQTSDVHVNSDSSYLVISRFTSTTSSVPGILFTRISKTGDILVQKDYLSDNQKGCFSFMKNKLYYKLSNSSLLVLGAYFNDSSKAGIVLLKINAITLDTAWVKYFSDVTFDLPSNDIIKIDNNRFWLIGNKYDNNNTSYLERPVIHEVDTSGNIVFRKEIPNLLKHTPGASLYDIQNQLVYVAGTNYTIPQSPLSFIACIDTSGNIIWKKQNYGPVGFGQMELNNNYLVLSGQYYAGDFSPPNTSSPTYKLHITKVNTQNGDIIWQKNYGQKKMYNCLWAFTINPDESITSSGSYYPETVQYGGQCEGIILKVNSSGDSLWYQSYGNYYQGSVHEIFHDIKPTPDGGYIMCGVPHSAPSTHAWVVKTDSLGNAPGKTTQIHESTLSKELFNIYPNPANDKVYVQIKNTEINYGLSYTILSLNGEVLEKNNPDLDNNRILITTGHLDTGIYLLQISNGKQTVINRLVISR